MNLAFGMRLMMRLLSKFLLSGLLVAPVFAEESRPLPDYSARLLGSDQEVRFSDYAGSVLLINTWATWCPPCRAEMPDFEAIHQKYRARGLVVVGVNIDEGRADDAVAKFVSGLRISFPVWRDPRNRFSKRFRTLGVPESFLVDRAGQIVKHWQGPLNPNQGENLNMVQAALEATPKLSKAQRTEAIEATPKRGRRIAEQRGCLNCHSTDGSPGPGPSWSGSKGQIIRLTDGRQIRRDRAYLRRAILRPDADIVSGYREGVMAGAMPGKPLRSIEVEALVLYIQSLMK